MPPQVRPDAGLLDRLLFAAQGGDNRAAADLVEAASAWIERVVKRHCRRLGLPPHEVDDIVQETFVRVLDPRHQRYFSYRRKPRVSRGSFAPAHAYFVGNVLSAIRFGKRRRRSEIDATLGDVMGADIHVGVGQLEAKITAASLVSSLPAKTREVVLRVYVQEQTEREAAAAVELSAPTVCRMLRRFRERAVAGIAS